MGRLLSIYGLIFVIALFSTNSSAGVSQGQFQSNPISLGMLKDFKGKKHALGEFVGHGKWTVVMFWSATCEVCNATAEQYAQFHKQQGDAGVSVIGVSLNGLEHVDLAKTYVQRHGIEFDNFIGKYESLHHYFAALTGETQFGTPSFLFFSPEGELRAQQVGAVPPEMIINFIQEENAAMQSDPEPDAQTLGYVN